MKEGIRLAGWRVVGMEERLCSHLEGVEYCRNLAVWKKTNVSLVTFHCADHVGSGPGLLAPCVEADHITNLRRALQEGVL